MPFLSLSFHRIERPSPCQPCSGNLEACYFERQVLSGRAEAGGILTWLPREGTPRRIVVAMTWDVLAELRAELARHACYEPDDVIVRRVLCHWGIREYRHRLSVDATLPGEGLLLETLGGPHSDQALHLLEVSGLLEPAAAG